MKRFLILTSLALLSAVTSHLLAQNDASLPPAELGNSSRSTKTAASDWKITEHIPFDHPDVALREIKAYYAARKSTTK